MGLDLKRIRKRVRRNRVWQMFQYFLVRFLLSLVSVFDIRRALKIGRYLGLLFYMMDIRHRKVGFDNLRHGLAGLDKQALERLLKEVYSHLGMSVIELSLIMRVNRHRNLLRYIRLENFHIMDRLLDKGQGIICVIGHLGNWELAGLAVSQAGYPLNSLARPLENVYLDNYLNSVRKITGQNIIPKYNAMNFMKNVLKSNQVLVIQVDQNTKNGVFVDFFGRKAGTIRSPALLSLRYGTPIVPVNIYRELGKNGYFHRVILTEPIYPDVIPLGKDKIAYLTALYTSRLEEFIRQHPDQWIWIHRRWKAQPKKQDRIAQGKNTILSR